MAVAAGAANPMSCLGVLTEAAQAFVEDRTIAGIRAAAANFRDPDQVARLARYHGEKAPWVLEAWIDTWLSDEFAGWTLTGSLEQLRCPVLAIHGDRDEYGTAAHPDRIEAHAGRGARTVLLHDTGHVPHRERQTEVLSLIKDFVWDISGVPEAV